MKSPVGSRKRLQSVLLEDNLIAYRCPESGGHYIPAVSYMRWLSKQPARLPNLPSSDAPQQEEQVSERACLCPETDTIMTKYAVGHGFPFKIDRSITGGIWLDSGEWEALRRRNFHDELHFIFTEPWQRGVILDSNLVSSLNRLKERIGADLLERMEAFRKEIDAHPHRAEILAYLNHMSEQAHEKKGGLEDGNSPLQLQCR
jgi:hypothetical protein